MAALQVISSGTTLAWGIRLSKFSASCHWKPFTQALMAALKVIWFGITLVSGIRLNRFSASCHWPPSLDETAL
jgi:hypothetical protein